MKASYSGLLLNGSAHGAGISASAAVDASVSVDHELAVALRNSGNGAALSASAAGDAFVSNLVSHDNYLLIFASA